MAEEITTREVEKRTNPNLGMLRKQATEKSRFDLSNFPLTNLNGKLELQRSAAAGGD